MASKHNKTLSLCQKRKERFRKENMRKLNERRVECEPRSLCHVELVEGESIDIKDEPVWDGEGGENGPKASSLMPGFVKTEYNDNEELQPPVEVFVKTEPSCDSDLSVTSSGITNEVDPLQLPSSLEAPDKPPPELHPVVSELLAKLAYRKSPWNVNGSRCCYKGCTASRRSRPDLNFFSFPIRNTQLCGGERLERWLVNCGNEGLTALGAANLRNRYICSLHFAKSDLITTSTRVVLKYNAVPLDWNAATSSET